MATIYSSQFTCVPLSDAYGDASQSHCISPSDLKAYYPSYYHRAFEDWDDSNLYLVSYCNNSVCLGKLRTYYAVLPFRSIASYVTPFGEISPCLSESQLRRFALIIRCCHYRFYWHVNKTFVYNHLLYNGVNLERPL